MKRDRLVKFTVYDSFADWLSEAEGAVGCASDVTGWCTDCNLVISIFLLCVLVLGTQSIEFARYIVTLDSSGLAHVLSRL